MQTYVYVYPVACRWLYVTKRRTKAQSDKETRPSVGLILSMILANNTFLFCTDFLPSVRSTVTPIPTADHSTLCQPVLSSTQHLHHPQMPVLTPLPPLLDILNLLSQPPAAPSSLNLLHILLVPFLTSASSTAEDTIDSQSRPTTWQTIYDYYEPGTQAYVFYLDNDQLGVPSRLADSTNTSILDRELAVILLRPPPIDDPDGRSYSKLHLAFTDPTPGPIRTNLFASLLSSLPSLLPTTDTTATDATDPTTQEVAAREVYIAGLPTSLWPAFKRAVLSVSGGGSDDAPGSFRVSKELNLAVEGKGRKGGKMVGPLKEGLELGEVEREEVQVSSFLTEIDFRKRKKKTWH